MDEAEKVISVVKKLLPGIVVATIFYLYSNAKFDEFFFIVFCVICVGLTGIVSRPITSALTYIIQKSRAGWAWVSASVSAKPASTSEGRRVPSTGNEGALETSTERQWPLVIELAVAVLLGLLLVKVYEDDLSFRLVNQIFDTEKISVKDTFDYISDNIKKKNWDYIDERPEDRKFCKKSSPACIDDVYVRISIKDAADIYEGAITNYPSVGERNGMYLSPACVRRRAGEGKYEPAQVVAGPGVYVNVTEVTSIEYIAIRDSDCFKLYYPKGL